MNPKNKIKNLIYTLLIFPFFLVANQTNHIETIYLGSGCFWGAEKGYEAPEGVN